MAKVALDGATNNTSTTSSSHITYDYKVWDSCHHTEPSCCDEDGCSCDRCVGDYWYYSGSTSATISGTCNASSNSVYINSKNAILKGDSTTESDDYTITDPNYYNVSGDHSNATGSVSGGNSNNVYVNGKSIAVIGSSITTHASTSTTIASGGSSNVYVGG